MSSLPDPADEPATVSAALRRTGRAAALLGEEHRAVRRSTADLATGWSGADADAAAAELSTLAALLRTGAAALTTATSALSEYRDALELARTALGAVRGEYDETVQERDLRVQRGLTGLSHGAAPEQRAAVAEDLGRPDEAHLHCLIGRFEAIGNDVQAAARRLAGALATANQSLHLSGAPTPLAVTQRLATALPSWGAGAVQDAVAAAVRAIDGAHGLSQLQPALAPYAGWADVPAFAAAFLKQIGPQRFGALLTDPVPVVYGASEQQMLDAVYGLLGRILAAGTRDDPPRRWLRRLLAGPDPNRLRTGVGMALRHGHYGTGALLILAPALIAHPGEPGISVQQPECDPLIGAMSALAGDPVAAARILGNRGTVATLLHRQWRADEGRSLGAALAAGARLPAVVDIVGADPDLVPRGISAGLGALIGAGIAAVNRSLLAGESIDLPGPGERMPAVPLARTMMLAMGTSAGSAAIYAHQAAYAGSVLAGATASAAAVDGLCENAGRLAGIHQRAIAAGAARADAQDEADANADTWISMAEFAAGFIPLPARVASPVSGAAKGLIVGRIAQALQDELFRKPLQRRRSGRHKVADRVIADELAASERFCRELVAKAFPNGPPAFPGGLDLQQVCRQAGAAGQNDVARRLLADAPTR